MAAATHTIFTTRLAIGAALALTVACHAQAARYKVQLLDTGAYSAASVQDINNAGQTVGIGYLPGTGGSRAVRWNGTAMTTLDAAADGSAALALNNHGVVVGWVSGAGGGAATWNAAGQRTIIGRPGWSTRAVAINDAGQMAGIATSITSPFDIRALRWSGPSLASEDLFGRTATSGDAIDGAGRVGGREHSLSNYAYTQASTWLNGGQTYLPGLGGIRAHVTAMNEAGVAVGDALTAGTAEAQYGQLRAVKWALDGTPSILPAAGAFESRAMDVNSRGQVLGTIQSKNFWGILKTRAVIWDGDQVIDLTASLDFWHFISGWNVAEVMGLNDAGQVAVQLRRGTNDDTLRPAVLTPVPAAK